jgi:hypothetical protein
MLFGSYHGAAAPLFADPLIFMGKATASPAKAPGPGSSCFFPDIHH